MEVAVQRAALMLALIVALGACGSARDSGGKTRSTLADLQGEAEYGLLPPGATDVVIVRSSSGAWTPTGYRHSSWERRFFSPSPFAEVAKYYHDELTRRGWLPDLASNLPAGDEDGRGWCHFGRRAFVSVRIAQRDVPSLYTTGVSTSDGPCPMSRDVRPLPTFPAAPPRPPAQSPP